MNPEKVQALKEHAEASPKGQASSAGIAAILYEEADPEQLATLAGIEATVRAQLLEHVTPHIGVFLSVQSQAHRPVATASSKASSANCP